MAKFASVHDEDRNETYYYLQDGSCRIEIDPDDYADLCPECGCTLDFDLKGAYCDECGWED